MAPFEALYLWRYKSPIGWFEIDEATVVGSDLVLDTLEKVQLIRERLKIAQSRQKSYANMRRKDLEFGIGDFVYFKISPMKGVKDSTSRENSIPDILVLIGFSIASIR